MPPKWALACLLVCDCQMFEHPVCVLETVGCPGLDSLGEQLPYYKVDYRDE
jgi:hypothetical protein